MAAHQGPRTRRHPRVVTFNCQRFRDRHAATGKAGEPRVPVSDQVTAVEVAVGDQVKTGQVLAKIDTASLVVSVAHVKASVATEQAKVDTDVTTGADAAQTAADQAALTAADNQLASAQSRQAQATMTCPIDGVVATVNRVRRRRRHQHRIREERDGRTDVRRAHWARRHLHGHRRQRLEADQRSRSRAGWPVPTSPRPPPV
jgi:pyruvate/2-oxoglutarate dehydrogenase complex dihydrolipoamide acyltransferase (E2) component